MQYYGTKCIKTSPVQYPFIERGVFFVLTDMVGSWQQQIFPLLASRVRKCIDRLPQEVLAGVEEIRLRQGRSLLLETGRGQVFPELSGGVTGEDIRETLNLLSQYSYYAFSEQLAQGFLTVAGGHRVGVAGRTAVSEGRVSAMAAIGSLNIRVAREIKGAADRVLPWLVAGQQVYNTLIIAPPRAGKTTLLRDVVRQFSDGWLGFSGVTVGLVDERSEIAGCYLGVPQLDVGQRTDVLDSCPKEYGLLMLVRSMGPRVVAADELGRLADVEAIEAVLAAGVTVLSTAHARDLAEARQRPALKVLLERSCFQRVVILTRAGGKPVLAGVMSLPQEKWLFRGV